MLLFTSIGFMAVKKPTEVGLVFPSLGNYLAGVKIASIVTVRPPMP